MEAPTGGPLGQGVSKASDLSSRSRGEAWENLPFGFYAGPGPSAWRPTKDPMERDAAAMMAARGLKKLSRQKRKNLLMRLLTRDETEDALRDMSIAQQMRSER